MAQSTLIIQEWQPMISAGGILLMVFLIWDLRESEAIRMVTGIMKAV